MKLFTALMKRLAVVCYVLFLLFILLQSLFFSPEKDIEFPYEITEIASNVEIKYTQCDQHSPEEIVEEISRRGNIGRLTIPSLEIDVALFDCEPNNNSQFIVNAVDSAAYIRYSELNGRDIIADHNFQGFEEIKRAIPGETCAFINNGESVEAYICVSMFQGNNTQDDITDMNGNSVVYQDDELLCMYTCNETWQSITITLWQRVILSEMQKEDNSTTIHYSLVQKHRKIIV